MKPNNLSLKTRIGLCVWYLGRTALLVLPILLMQAIVIAVLYWIIQSNLLRIAKTILVLIVLAFGESIVYSIWFALKEKFMDYPAFRQKVARETKNKRLYEELLTNDWDENVRLAAIEPIRDANRLSDIALTEVSWRIRIAAAERVRRPDEAEALLRRSDDPLVRQTALSNIRDEATLREYALNDPDFGVRATAAERIESPEILLKIMDGAQDTNVWRVCLPKLIRNSKAGGIIPESVWAAIRNAAHSETVQHMEVCPDCCAKVTYQEEYRDADIDNINEYDEDPTLVEFWQFYQCQGCGKEVCFTDFSVPLGTLLSEK